MLYQQTGNAFEFFEKTFCDDHSSVFAVKIQGIGKVLLRFRMKRVAHR